MVLHLVIPCRLCQRYLAKTATSSDQCASLSLHHEPEYIGLYIKLLYQQSIICLASKYTCSSIISTDRLRYWCSCLNVLEPLLHWMLWWQRQLPEQTWVAGDSRGSGHSHFSFKRDDQTDLYVISLCASEVSRPHQIQAVSDSWLAGCCALVRWRREGPLHEKPNTVRVMKYPPHLYCDSGDLYQIGRSTHKAVSYTHLTLPTIYSV